MVSLIDRMRKKLLTQDDDYDDEVLYLIAPQEPQDPLVGSFLGVVFSHPVSSVIISKALSLQITTQKNREPVPGLVAHTHFKILAM